ncbi:MAG: TonB-dependent siderophore receptor [Nodosilinea sp.]
MRNWQLLGSVQLAVALSLAGGMPGVGSQVQGEEGVSGVGFQVLGEEEETVQGVRSAVQGAEGFDSSETVNRIPATVNREPYTVQPEPITQNSPPATTISDWIAQIEASLVQITGVRIETTEAGLQIVLDTAEGTLATPTTQTVGNALIADIPNAVLALPEGDAFEQFGPAEGIALVSVTNEPGDRVRVAITGTDAPPVTEVTATGLAVTLGEAVVGAEDDAIQVVVTGEQDEGYNPRSASTATRTDTPLRDIPQSIQVVPQQVLRDQNVTNINEALQNVPGVVTTTSSRRTVSAFQIRGFTADQFSGNNLLRNGLRETGFTFMETSPDIERIEVLRGPASVLYGQSTPGGTVNLVTKQPLRDPFYAVDATVGSYSFYRGAIDLSGPLNDSRTVSYRLNAAYLDRESFVDFFNLRQYTIAPVVSVAFGAHTRFTVEGEYTDRRRFGGEGPLPAVGTLLPNPNGRIPRNRNISEPEESAFHSISRVGYRLEHEFNDNWSIQHAFQWKRFRFEVDREIFATSFDADNRTLNRRSNSRLDGGTNRSIYSLNTNLTGRFSTGSINHQLIFGIDLGRYDGFNPSVVFRDAAPIDVFNPIYGQPLKPIAFTTDPNGFFLDTLGFYLQDQVTLAENLKLLLGGRFDLVRNTDRDFQTNNDTIEWSNAFTPRVGIVYQPIEPISLYASYSRSFTPLEGTTFEGDLFQPERGTQYEIGFKADVNDRLSATLALYNLTRSNVLTADNRPGVPPNQFSIQTGEQRSRGFEISVQGEVLPGWNILAGYAYTDARVTQDNRLPEGNRLPNAPENTFNLWTSYELQEGDLQGLGFGLGLFFVGDRQVDFANTIQNPSYLRTDAAIYYRRDRFRAALNFRNLFNVDYFENAEGLLRVFPGDPFTVQGTISWQF